MIAFGVSTAFGLSTACYFAILLIAHSTTAGNS